MPLNITSFFDQSYQTPAWLSDKFTRRSTLKSAAGMLALAVTPQSLANKHNTSKTNLHAAFLNELTRDPWKTLDAVLLHLLPQSSSGPGAQDIQLTQYLMNVVQVQPTDMNEVEFIFKGVEWLNGFTQSQVQQNFIQLSFDKKESMLRAISGSTAGENWLNNLIGYIFEAMLSPPSYGGNPNGIGWQWLEHQAGYPLPPKGKRYYELPGQAKYLNRSKNESAVNIPIRIGEFAYKPSQSHLKHSSRGVKA